MSRSPPSSVAFAVPPQPTSRYPLPSPTSAYRLRLCLRAPRLCRRRLQSQRTLAVVSISMTTRLPIPCHIPSVTPVPSPPSIAVPSVPSIPPPTSVPSITTSISPRRQPRARPRLPR
ncbi:hypothetical protein HYPSUDRAFT_205316 [Hypholoma sublateritium FD-334 SS-4]|uniref:Uncharacterized protein n=1 Tax=Hypholoma sublateritium (strain FD-334 SS-4) TaxID=945553 RepID=A0A0D2KUW4_HYPSF|nr:hypothetical protein HYPSUDRAFT_205316 [Hypholoma sublateritium FD-334 SS-4]